MRKKVTGRTPETAPPGDKGWLNLEDVAEGEVTSEEPDYPVEAALIPGKESGWRTALAGQQVIRLFLTARSRFKESGYALLRKKSSRRKGLCCAGRLMVNPSRK
jgi:hypothetical protein